MKTIPVLHSSSGHENGPNRLTLIQQLFLVHRYKGSWSQPHRWPVTLVLALALMLLGSTAVTAHESPVGCTGSALGINLFTDSKDVHIGESITYSVTVFNGLPGSPRIACDATGIVAGVVTPDGVTNKLTLIRTALSQGQSDFYPNIVTYIVRAQDILPDGTVRATAFDDGDIHQNDTDSRGGGDQGLNSEVIQPCILVNAVCVGSVGEKGAITFTGTVLNCGNAPLDNVMVTNQVNGGAVRVIGPINLAIGQSKSFSGSWVPANPCLPSTATFVATGTDNLTLPRTVTSTSSTTCQNTLTPAIRVTKACPPGPVAPGQLLVYSGTVTNIGDVTLTNVIVVSDQPAANTTVFTIASLAPGAGASFTANYTAPVDCSTTSSVTATGTSVCGVQVTSTASSTCPILTAPKIKVTAACPPGTVTPGSTVTYSGTVSNTGNIALNNITVVSDRPSANTTVFTVGTLAPGATASFTGTYTVPANACSVTTTLGATGHDICSANATSDTTTITCPVTTNPHIAVTLVCPGTPSAAGGPITYTGTVSNTGDVTLNNVTVVDTQASPATVFTVATLAPGASANFSATFNASANACSISSTVTATGSDACSAVAVSNSASATCPLLTSPHIAVTQNCPTASVGPGGSLTFTGTVKNTGDVTVTNVVVLNDHTGTTPLLTVASLAPGASASFTGSFPVAADVCSISSTSSAQATSICGVAVSDSASSTCTILTAPQISVTIACPTGPVVPGGSLTFTGTVHNGGNITLKNVIVVSDQPAPNTTVFTAGTLAPGASANFTGTFTVPANACSVSTTVNATGNDNCTGAAVTQSATSTCPVTTAPQVAVTLSCPNTSSVPGGLITYTGTVSNPGNVTLNNVTVTSSQASPATVLTVPTLAPGGSANFTVSFTTPLDACSVSASVSASGTDNCASKVISNTASATCPLVTAPGIAVTENCPVAPTSPGGLFTFSGTVRNTGNVTLTNVVVLNNAVPIVPPITNPPVSTGAIWVEDSLPPGALGATDGGDSWNFISNNPPPFSGHFSHQSNLKAGQHQHYFTGAFPFPIGTGDLLVAYIYIDPVHVPDEVMLQWSDGSFEHRAYWGANLLNFGTDGTASRLFMGQIPAAGQWVQLAVPAVAVGLDGHSLRGMAFTLYGGRATWDAAGRMPGSSGPHHDAALAASDPTTPVFTAATLAPGQVASFTGSFTLPADSGCSITTSLTATGNDKCTGVAVSGSTTSTCPLVTSPAIEVTQNCPDNPGIQGGTLTFSGTVRNTGNITLTNVIVLDDRVGPTPVFTAATMVPGASANFTGSYVVPLNCCTVSSTLSATGNDICTGTLVSDTATATCPVVTSPAISVTKSCPPLPLEPGDRLKYTGTVVNTGNITLTNVTVVDDQPAPNTTVLGPITLAPGESVKFFGAYTVPLDFCGTDTVTAHGFDSCTGVAVSNAATTTCPILTTPQIAVTKVCPANPTPRGGLYVFTGSVSNPGNVTLVNVFVVNNQPTNNTPVIGPITLAPGASASFSGSYTAPLDCCQTTDTLTARGQDRCATTQVTSSASAVCPLLTTPQIAVTEVCPPNPVSGGGTFEFHGTVSNVGDVNLTNVMVFSSRPGGIQTKVLGPVELAPGETASFTGSYVVPIGGNTSGDIVLATGMDTCQARTVTAKANCSGPVGQSVPVIRSITMIQGVSTVAWDAIPGVSYRLQCKGILNDPIWIDIPGDVTANGSTCNKTDEVGPTQRRFYRVVVLE